MQAYSLNFKRVNVNNDTSKQPKQDRGIIPCNLAQSFKTGMVPKAEDFNNLIILAGQVRTAENV
ncbi:hypothetical protein Sps_01470 [Shewanella psychrophila]|uniref:Uncharacterized protein n=1 Tax=Shewanella psychrophila TaxID=225848 RepID=A0A1S6HM70_9GAMM|nr:hypothetical protein Sps_01470 [Shewanella psychrophila]